ncbi:MAG TPA: hypothetical protein VGV57_08630 [Thermoleophilaceae bacterium]|nr:hypothetical protein [Thermoleophilaceae bacterium]
MTVTSDESGEARFASAPYGSSPAPWISVGRAYTFRLYSTGSGRRLLARLTVGKATKAAVIAPPPRPRITSPVVNRLLQLLSFAGVALLALLAAMWVREVRGDG